MANYQQPDYRVPVTSASVIAVSPTEGVLIPGPNEPPFYVQPMIDKEDPQTTTRHGKSGHL